MRCPWSVSVFNSMHRIEQWLLVGWRVKKELAQPPLFVLGHWRTGTTLLHELLALDTRHTCPTTYECFAPSHFLITEGAAIKLFGFLLPSRRPMDNMPIGWTLPQGGRVRAVQSRRAVALSDDRLPQRAAAGPGISHAGACPRQRHWSVGSGRCGAS
jgi:hypothetical protein